MKLLAIETSCDETSAAVVENGRRVLSDIISSQVDVHRKYGGVVPEIASRKHIEAVLPVIDAALKAAHSELSELSAIAVTRGPGLVGGLLVGVSVAKALSYALDKPLIAVNHMEGHIYSNLVEHPHLQFPFLTLVVSGGHTMLVDVPDQRTFQLLGETVDDAAGEAFDKVARVMGYSYPGGPEIESLAKTGDSLAIEFPQALMVENNYQFSFSGLKSAVINYLHNQRQRNIAYRVEDVAASFQYAVVEVLAQKTIKAATSLGRKQVCIAGGVAANTYLRNRLQELCDELGYSLFYPSLRLCTDNAVMIGCRAYYQYLENDVSGWNLNAIPRLTFQGR